MSYFIAVKLSPLNPTTEATEDMFFSELPYYGNEKCLPLIRDSFSYDETAAKATDLFSGGSMDVGDITLVNSSGHFDSYSGYGFDGQAIEVFRVTESTSSMTSTNRIFSGVMKSLTVDLDLVTIAVQSPLAFLDKPLQTSTFAGPPPPPPSSGSSMTPPGGGSMVTFVGGEDYAHRIEGDEDLKGKKKPMAFGRCLTVAPTLLNSSYQIYGVNYDSAGNRKPAHIYYVMDGGALLVVETIPDLDTFFTRSDNGDLDYGYAYVLESEGLICLTSKPEKQLTAFVESGADLTLPGIITDVISEVDNTVIIDTTALSGETAIGGVYVGGSETAYAVLKKVMASTGIGVYATSNGVLTFKKIINPKLETPTTTITDSMFSASSLKVDNGLRDDGVPIYKVGVEYNNRVTKISPDGLLGAAGREARSLLTENEETSYSESASIQALHRLSTEKVYESVLAGPRPCLLRNTHFEIPLNLPLSSYLAGWEVLEGEYTRTVLNSGQATITLPNHDSTMYQEMVVGTHIDYGTWEFSFVIDAALSQFQCFVQASNGAVTKAVAADNESAANTYTCTITVDKSSSHELVKVVVIGKVTISAVTAREVLAGWKPDDESSQRLAIHTKGKMYYLDYLPPKDTALFDTVLMDIGRLGISGPLSPVGTKALVVGRTLDENSRTQSLILLGGW